MHLIAKERKKEKGVIAINRVLNLVQLGATFAKVDNIARPPSFFPSENFFTAVLKTKKKRE